MTSVWPVVRMGELCTITSGSSDTQDAVADGEFAFFDRSKIVKRSNRFLHDCEALIIPGEGATFLPRYFRGKFDLHQRAYAIFDLNPKLNIHFLYYCLYFQADYFPRVAVGATVKSLRRRHFEEFPVPLPPLAEQQRIVRLLDEAFKGIAIAKANAEKNLQNARALFGSHLQTVFTHGTDEWQSMRLGDVCSLITRGISPSYAEDGDIIVLNQRCVRNHQVDLEQSRRHSSHIRSVAPARFVQRGDVLVNSTGVGTLGRLGQIKTVPVAPITVDSHVTILRPKVDLFTEAFFGYMLISIESEITLLGQGSGGQTELAKSALSAMKVAWPTSLAEQQRIVSELNALVASSEVLTSTYVKKLAALDALVQSLLKHSFSGDLVAA